MTIEHVVVAVPARDEAELLPACLRSVLAAGASLTARALGLEVVVALDGCTDASAQIAAEFGVTCIEVPSVGVGAARDAAVRAGLGAAPVPVEAVWIANTDADTVVPATWLAAHLTHADAGADVVVGTVEPVGVTDAALLAAWHDRHELRENHTYVHGANLGVRGSTYEALGGFTARRVHEDVDLVARARRAGCPVVATDTTRVRTAGRLTGRVEQDGFAAYLEELRSGNVPADDMAASGPGPSPLPQGAS